MARMTALEMFHQLIETDAELADIFICGNCAHWRDGFCTAQKLEPKGKHENCLVDLIDYEPGEGCAFEPTDAACDEWDEIFEESQRSQREYDETYDSLRYDGWSGPARWRWAL